MVKKISNKIIKILQETPNDVFDEMIGETGDFDIKYDKNLGLELIFNENFDNGLRSPAELIKLKFNTFDKLIENTSLGENFYLSLMKSENNINTYKILAHNIENEENSSLIATIKHNHSNVPKKGIVSVLKTVKRTKELSGYNLNNIFDAAYHKFKDAMENKSNKYQ